MNDVMLTTIDNPFNPFEQFADWYMFDCQHGYNTSSRIARLTPNDPTMSSIENDRLTEQVIDQIIKYDPLGIYVKVDEATAKEVAHNAQASK